MSDKIEGIISKISFKITNNVNCIVKGDKDSEVELM